MISVCAERPQGRGAGTCLGTAFRSCQATSGREHILVPELFLLFQGTQSLSGLLHGTQELQGCHSYVFSAIYTRKGGKRARQQLNGAVSAAQGHM